MKVLRVCFKCDLDDFRISSNKLLVNITPNISIEVNFIPTTGENNKKINNPMSVKYVSYLI